MIYALRYRYWCETGCTSQSNCATHKWCSTAITNNC